MRTGKELILATKPYTQEDRTRSWVETIITMVLIIAVLSVTFLNISIWIRLPFSILTGLLYVRMFVIYHDYQHHAILQKSPIAELIMKAYGLYILTPQTIWKRSHDHHHNHNSKLTIIGIGSYPTISKMRYTSLSKKEQRIYLLTRHPLTVIFGYFTLFIYWLNIKSFTQSFRNHWDSLVALVLHIIFGVSIWYFMGAQTFLTSFFVPFFLAFAIGSYLFYSQHNFPSAKFRESTDWSYDNAALSSTSFMVMNPIMTWLTGFIGYHHVHHMNSRIPFYRLKEAMDGIPELQNVATTTLHPMEMYRCFRVKLWDPEQDRMITLRDL